MNNSSSLCSCRNFACFKDDVKRENRQEDVYRIGANPGNNEGKYKE